MGRAFTVRRIFSQQTVLEFLLCAGTRQTAMNWSGRVPYLTKLAFQVSFLLVLCLFINCVNHNELWKILKEMGIPDYLTCFLRNLYAGQEPTVRTQHGTTDWFQIGKGVCQGCVLSPCLFNLYNITLCSPYLPPYLPPEKPVCRSRSNGQNQTQNNGLVQNWERSMSRLCIVTLLI